VLDADNFNHSSIFDEDSKSGLGGWGDPNDEFQITTGGFASDFELKYPIPHHLRRSITLVLSQNETLADGTPLPNEPLNTFITPQLIEGMVDGFPGDFVGFQSFMDTNNGSHGVIHLMVGGYVAARLWCSGSLTPILSDLSGACPEGTQNCTPGPKWSPNGLFCTLAFSSGEPLTFVTRSIVLSSPRGKSFHAHCVKMHANLIYRWSISCGMTGNAAARRTFGRSTAEVSPPTLLLVSTISSPTVDLLSSTYVHECLRPLITIDTSFLRISLAPRFPVMNCWITLPFSN